MFVVSKGSKVNFYCVIMLLCLAVGLRLESGREIPFDTQEVALGGSELEREY